MNINQSVLNQALQLLGSILDRDEQAKSIHFVVCGGSSMIMMGLVTRTTRDVDIVAYLEKNQGPNELQYASTIPKFLQKAASRVSADLGLDEQWLNTGPKDLLQYGLPDGFVDRLYNQKYGEKLAVSFISRFDQIHFKMYAAVDSGPGRHVDDLLALRPTAHEIEQAARWVLKQDPSSTFKQMLINMLKALSYGSVVEKI